MTADTSIPETAVLPAKDCRQLLQGDSVGRLAVWVNDHPEIFPVNYKVDHESLVFRTGPGTKLESALGKAVALEADGADTDRGVAWSVVVKGRAPALSRTPELMGPLDTCCSHGRRVPKTISSASSPRVSAEDASRLPHP